MNSLGVVAHRLYFYITCFGISQMHVKKSGSIVVTMKAYISFFCFCMEYGFELPCLYHIFWDFSDGCQKSVFEFFFFF